MSVVYKATNVYGETAHFGAHSAAMAWAKSGTVAEVPVRDLRIVPTLSAQNIDDRFAGRLAFMLECLIVDYHGNWDAACALLDEYKAEWEAVNPSPPTFMGEPMPLERRERLEELRNDRAEIAQKLRALPEFKERGR